MDRMALWLVLFHFSFVAGCSMFRFVKQQGLALDNHVISTITASYDSKCRLACVENPLCFSMNVQSRDTGAVTCELNNSSKSADPQDLQPRAGYEYYQMAELVDHCTADHCYYKDALPDGWYRFGSKLLKLFPERKDWKQAQQFCQSIGGDLVSIKDEKENEFVHALLGTMATNTTESDSDVIGHWKLDGTDADVNLFSSATYAVEDGKKCLFLDGTGAHATTQPVDIHSTSVTIMSWVKLLGPAASDEPIYSAWASSPLFLFTASSAYLRFGGIDNNGHFQPWFTGGSPPIGTWFHAAVMWDKEGSKAYIFQDGEIVAARDLTSGSNFGSKSYALYDIGLKRDTGITLKGYLKDLKVIRRTVTEEEIVDYEGTNRAVDGVWIGLNDNATEGTFQWDDNSTVTYTKWASGEPDNQYNYQDCVAMKINDGGNWEDNSCRKSLPFVCGKSA